MLRGRLRATRHQARQRWLLLYWRARVGAHRFAAFGERSIVYRPLGILNPHRIEIGDRVLVHQGAMFSVVEELNGRRHEPRLRIGDDTRIGHGIWFSCVGEIEIGERNLLGHNILIADSYHEYQDPDTPIVDQPMAPAAGVRIEPGCIIGPHAAILAGVTIGRGSFVAANSVVTRSVEANSVVAGNPARVIRSYDRLRAEWVDHGSLDSP